MLPLENVEDAIVAALANDASIKAFAKTVTSFQGELTRARAASVAIQLPAVLVGYAGGPTQTFGAWSFQSKTRWQVTVACENFRSASSPRKGTEKGAYDLIKDVLRVLSGQTLGLDIGELKPISVEPNDKEERTTVAEYFVVFETDINFDLSESDFCTAGETTPQTVADLETLTAEHSVLGSDGFLPVVTDTHEVGV